MALKYWVAKDSTFGASAGTGTETDPYLGALALRTAHGTGVLAGDIVVFMGEYGPIGLADAADFPNTFAAAVSNSIIAAATSGGGTTLGTNCGIIFGNNYTNGSNASNIIYRARGDLPWHVDMRGNTTNAQRMRAALAFQGSNIGVEDWRIACSDYNYIGDGTNRITAASQIVPGNTYAAECSAENMGLLLWGTGFEVFDNTVWGSDAFSRSGILYAYHTTTVDPNPNYLSANTRIERNIVYGTYAGIQGNYTSILDIGGTYRPPRTCHLTLHRNTVSSPRWGDTATIPVVNNALHHAGTMSITGNYDDGRARATVTHNDLSGECQDLLECIATQVEIADNYIHDGDPYVREGTNPSLWLVSGANWTLQTTYTFGQNGIKAGLSAYDGTSHATIWLGAGTPGGAYNVDQCRNRVVRNRIKDVATVGVTTNGSGGMFIHANEITGGRHGIKCETNTSMKQTWISNNYCAPTSSAAGSSGLLVQGQSNYVFAYNNVFNGGSAAGNDFDMNMNQFGGAGTLTVIGENNRMVNNRINVFGGGSTNALTGTTTGAAAYTVGEGPTAAGNCDTAGSSLGITGSRSTGAARDIEGRTFKVSTPPVGPRQRVLLREARTLPT